MTIPAFSDPCFPNSVSIVLCDDTGNAEGGYNPADGSATTFGASVQEKGASLIDRGGGAVVSVARYVVYFQVDPSLTLGRPLRAGDKIVWAGLTLGCLGGTLNRGGFDWLWRVNCEHVTV